MANAEVYVKWANQGDGVRGAGGWSLRGSGGAAGAGGIVPLNMHAERGAWKQAWGHHQQNNLRDYVQQTKDAFKNQRLQVKFWVDQQICPTCQKWLVIDVIAHLKELSRLNAGMIVELYAEVLFAGQTRRVRVQRELVWPVEVGLIANFKDLPVIYN